ncbi:hypothetical protein COO60DRAFT_273835 [Scenedesmus sp. NREL 46B-D3]|nr:hypothetical protein COO60DRAFT_273835 [Scenedesmus sp. NREL 46B-D3]
MLQGAWLVCQSLKLRQGLWQWINKLILGEVKRVLAALLGMLLGAHAGCTGRWQADWVHVWAPVAVGMHRISVCGQTSFRPMSTSWRLAASRWGVYRDCGQGWVVGAPVSC